MQTQREYLFGLGLTKNPVGRGRFSGQAHEALAKARSNGMTFDDDVREEKPKTVKVAKAPTVIVAKPTEKVDPKAVREWAKGKGIAIGERGRIHTDIQAQYLAETSPEDRPEIVGEFDVYRDSAPRRYPAGTRFVGTVQYKGQDVKVDVNDRTGCVHCKVSLSGHLCQTPAIVVGYGTPDFVSVTPVYPKGE